MVGHCLQHLLHEWYTDDTMLQGAIGNRSSGGVGLGVAAASSPYLRYVVTASATLAVVSTVNCATAPTPLNLLTLSYAAALGFGAGAVLGGGLSLVFLAVSRLPLRYRISAWSFFGCALALLSVQRLELIAYLAREQRQLAIALIGLSLCAGAAIGAVGLAAQPNREGASWLARRGRVAKPLCVALLLAAAIVLAWLDHRIAPVYLAAMRSSARASVVLLLTLAIVICMGPRRRRLLGPRAGALSWCAAGCAVLAPLLLLRSNNSWLLSSLLARPYAGLSLNLLRNVTDFDRDGYSPLLGGADCDDFSSKVNPRSREIPGNGIDDNCRLGDRASLASAQVEEAPPLPLASSPMSVVLITSDALSALHMSSYGYQRRTTPNIDKWAEQHGVLYQRTYSPGGSTTISLPSLFRGLYPRHLGTAPGTWPKPLARRLTDRGMRTVAITDAGTSGRLYPGNELSGPFALHVDMNAERVPGEADAALTSRALMELSRLGAQPFFLWLHYYGTHDPTTRHPGAPVFGSSVVDGYDHEIAAFDQQVAPLLAELTRRQVAGEPLAIILSSDHGETFRPNRMHAYWISETVGRVPLIVSLPGVAHRREAALASGVDIPVTILALTKTPIPSGLDGRDLRGLSERRTSDLGRLVFSDTWVHSPTKRVVADEVMVSDGSRRLTMDLLTSSVRLRNVTRPLLGQTSDELLAAGDDTRLHQALDQYLEGAFMP